MHDKEFSAKAWVDKLIAMQEGPNVDEVTVTHPMVGHAMTLGNFNAMNWVANIVAEGDRLREMERP